MKFKQWVPGMVLGTMITAMTAMPVMAGNINPGNTPPDRIFEGQQYQCGQQFWR